MSPVLDVTIQSHHGPPVHCVLKLYDRRFGTSLRYLCDDTVAPHTQANEEAFQTFVKRGMMPAFLGQLKEANETPGIPPAAEEFLDDNAEGCGKYEAALWRECNEHFRCETEAYTRLGDLQGKLIPRMLAHLRLVAAGDKPTSTPTDIPSEAASYFEVRGILLEYIDGYNLEDMTASALAPPADNLAKQLHLIQSAVDSAHEINTRGIIMDDCTPRNVVVDKQSQTPRIIDFAQCSFQDELLKLWHKWEWHKREDWDPDVEYWKRVDEGDNPEAIGAVMVHRVKGKTGVKLHIKYPNCKAIIADIKRGKAGALSNPGEINKA